VSDTALLPRIKSRLFIAANRRTTNLLDGAYASIQVGRSLDFDDLRAYVPGDEVDDIDWKATARTGTPLVKRYLQTRRQDVMFVVDTGRGMAAMAEGGESKRDIAIQIAGVLGYLSFRHGDSVGMISRAGDRVITRRPRSSEHWLEVLLRQIHDQTRLDAPVCDLPELVDRVSRLLRNRGIVIVIGDDVPPEQRLEDALKRLAARHELLWITVADVDLVRGDGSRREIVGVDEDMPVPALLRADRTLAKQYASVTQYRVGAQEDFFTRLGVSHARVRTVAEVVPTLLSLLRRRARAGY
jgi:uncharacterized protein (DUF58 family)